MKKPRRFRKLTIETDRTFIFRSHGQSQTVWCTQCGDEVEMVGVGRAAYETGLSELAIYQLIETKALHFTEDTDRRVLVCLSSLRAQMRQHTEFTQIRRPMKRAAATDRVEDEEQ